MKAIIFTSYLLSICFLNADNLFAQFNWEKYPGNPILSGDSSDSWKANLYMPYFFYGSNPYHLGKNFMCFSASTNNTSSSNNRPWQIGFASSDFEGISWNIWPFPVLTPRDDKWDHYSLESPCVEGGFFNDPYPYRMWYTAGDTNFSQYKIGYATSNDARNWDRLDYPVFEPRANSWESGGVGWCDVVRAYNYRMYYTGYNLADGRRCIGYATSEDQGRSWHRDTINNPILEPGVAGQWDDLGVFFPKIVYGNFYSLMFYTGYGTSDPNKYQIGLAISGDGIYWEKYPSNPILNPSDSGWDSGSIELGNVGVRDALYMYYDGYEIPTSLHHQQIGLAKSYFYINVQDLQLNQTNINFGNLSLGDACDTIIITLKNPNVFPVKIISISNLKSEFSLLELPNLPLYLSCEDSIKFKVCFKPLTKGTYSDEITIKTDYGLYSDSSRTIQLEGSYLLWGPKFQLFYDYVNSAATIAEKTTIVDSFMNANSVFPLIEDSIAEFIYYGEANSVSVPCDANNWLETVWPMDKIFGTSLWYRAQTFELDARIDYRFENNFNLFLDPRNPRVCPNAFGGNSELVMPNYIDAPEIEYYPEILHGSLVDTTITSSSLGNSRAIKIYLPPGYDSQVTETYGITLFNDGLDFINFAKAQNVFDYLIDKKRIKPLIGIFLPPVERNAEYAENKTAQYETFIVNELMPYIDNKYRTKKEPSKRAMLGISYGGLITTQICYNHPDCFGLAGLYSASYKVNSWQVFSSVLHGPVKDIKWYMDCGTYEPTIARTLFELRDSLIEKGYDVNWRQWHEGHSWGSWRAHLDIALEYFFPGDSVSVNVDDKLELPLHFLLNQNFPNPFNNSTTIKYSIPNTSKVIIKVFNVLGTEIQTLVNEEKPAGTYEVTWQATNLPSGIYFYSLRAGNFIDTKKMILLK